MTDAPARLESVNRIRQIRRDWTEDTRARVAAGEDFVVCNGDECEELMIAMDIPFIAVNYWNFLIVAQRKADYYYNVLRERGHLNDDFFALGYAATLDPSQAPWGGLPAPTLIVGSTRFESELRICELWAKEVGCPCIPLDFSFPEPIAKRLPWEWPDRMFNEWDKFVDSNRLEHRWSEERQVIRHLERATGKSFSIAELARVCDLINEQMDWWQKAQDLIAGAKRCPVTIRDQMSMYQAMWHRGTELGVDLIKGYHDEVEERVRNGVAAVPNEKIRFYYGSQTPPWATEIEQKYGATAVACYYTGIPKLYARAFDPDDPMMALAARHMLLFSFGPTRMIREAVAHRCDAVIGIEPHRSEYPSTEERECEAAGLPFLALPREADDAEIVDMVSRFFEDRFAASPDEMNAA